MKRVLWFMTLMLLIAGCGTETSGGGLEIEEIRERLQQNACRIQRDEFVFRLRDMEYRADSTYTAMPDSFPVDSLLFCPVTEEPYLMVVSGADRYIECPSGHGSTSL